MHMDAKDVQVCADLVPTWYGHHRAILHFFLSCHQKVREFGDEGFAWAGHFPKTQAPLSPRRTRAVVIGQGLS